MRKVGIFISVFAFVAVSCSQAPKNTKTTDVGVVINGVTWATRNIGERGAFVSQPYHTGNLYTWDEAKNACPAGWRLPTYDEMNNLSQVPYEWVTKNGVTGREFGTAPNTLFLPAAGCREFTTSVLDSVSAVGGVGRCGVYWCGTETGHFPYFIYFYSDTTGLSTDCIMFSCSVRCVAE
ncbi:MAG: hypothetical protein FWC39_09505 [Bacteroidetes bacterium]|nr:hypothetical protein [Bacteroidota bacterium]